MKASFDGARRNLANAFDAVISNTEVTDYNRLELVDLRNAVVILLCMYSDEAEDCSDLSTMAETLQRVGS